MDMRNVIEIYTEHKLAARYEVDDAPALQVGDRIVLADTALCIADIEHEFSGTRHTTRVTTSGNSAGRSSAPGPKMTDFLRYHVLVRVFDGDIGRWLGITRSAADATFLESLREEVASNPRLLSDIRKVVDTSGLWPAEADA